MTEQPRSTERTSAIDPAIQVAIDQAIAGYEPKWATQEPHLWASIGPVVRQAERTLGALNERHARSRCSQLTAYLKWCVDDGIGLDLEEAFQPANVERFTAGMTTGSYRTYKTNLTNWGPLLTKKAAWEPPPDPGPRSAPALPYDELQMMRWLRHVASQPTPELSQLLEGLVLLGAGVGLKGAEAALVRGEDVSRDEHAVWVQVRDRRVPCLSAYEERLWLLAERCGEDNLVGKASRVNGKTYLLVDPDTAETLSMSRLRMTWFYTVLRPMAPIRDVLQAANIKTAHSIDHIFPLLPPADLSVAMSWLRGEVVQ